MRGKTTLLAMALSAVAFSTAGCGASDIASPQSNSAASTPAAAKQLVGPEVLGYSDDAPVYNPPSREDQAALLKGPVSDVTARPMFQKPSNGAFNCWLLDKEGAIASSAVIAGTVNINWEVKGTGDFNRDGQPDILWRNKVKNTLAVWYMNGTTWQSSASLPIPAAGWNLVGVADFDGDGNPDLLWHNPTTGAVNFWKMQNTTVSSTVAIGTSPTTGNTWSIRAVGDFFQDRCADIVWQNDGNRTLKVWKWNGTARGADVSWAAPQAGFDVKGADDFSGDGQPDLLLQSPASLEVGMLKVADGLLAGYTMMGSTNSSRVLAGILPPAAPAVTRSAVDGLLKEGVFDATRNRVYLTNYTQNRVEVYDVATKKFLTPINVGSQPIGIDLTADGTKLVVCASGSNFVNVVDLASSAVTPVLIPNTVWGATTPQSVACAANNHALVGGGTQSQALFEVDLNSLTASISPSTDGVYAPIVRASSDRKTIVAAESGLSASETFRYSSISGQWTKSATIPTYIYSAAVNDLGLAIIKDWLVDAQSRVVAHFPSPANWSSGPSISCFSQDGSQVLGSYGREIIICETSRYQVIHQQKLPVAVVSALPGPTPNRFFVVAGSEVIDLNLPSDLPPVIEPMGAIKVPIGASATTRLQARDPEGQPLQFSASGLPGDAIFNQTTGELTFHPTTGSANESTSIILSASDGNCSKSITVNLVKLATTEKAIVFPVAGSLADLAIDPVRSILYVSNHSLNRIERFDYTNNAQLGSIPVGPGPRGLDFTPNADRLLVCSSGSEFLESVDLTQPTPSVTQSYYLAPGPSVYDRDYVPYSVACTTNNLVLVGLSRATSGGGGFTYPAQVNLNTGAYQRRPDLGYTNTPILVRSSKDRNRVGLQSSRGATITLDGNLLDPTILAPTYFQTFCLSTDGSQAMLGPVLAVYQAGSLLASALGSGTQFTWNGGNFAYRHNNGSNIEVFELPSLVARTGLTLPATASGRMLQTDDGAYLFVICDGGLCIRRDPAAGTVGTSATGTGSTVGTATVGTVGGSGSSSTVAGGSSAGTATVGGGGFGVATVGGGTGTVGTAATGGTSP